MGLKVRYYSGLSAMKLQTMVRTESSSTALGSPAAAFTLPDSRTGQMVSLDQFKGQPVFIAFICNHCPYVIHLIDALVQSANELAASGIKTIAISANDAEQYPADSPEKMGVLAREKNFDFPYCHDETQEVARAYDALCTPDLYLYDAQHKLYYRGQFDASRPGNGSASGAELKRVAALLLDQQPPPLNTTPSVGCSIKWKR